MASTYTIDASVFLNAFNPYEDGHDTSNQLLALLQKDAKPIIVPMLLLPEVAAAIGRGRGDTDLAKEFAATIAELPHLIWVPLDMILSRQAVDIAASHRLRGSDAVYAATAARFGSLLVTLDQEQRRRVAGVVTAVEPVEALRELT